MTTTLEDLQHAMWSIRSVRKTFATKEEEMSSGNISSYTW